MKKMKTFPSHSSRRAELIFGSLALSQTPAEAAGP